jgi:cytochrome c biogenesis protein CcdA
MTTHPGVAVAAAGVLSFASPWMIPVVPTFIARIGGQAPDERASRRRTFGHALLFVAGFRWCSRRGGRP